MSASAPTPRLNPRQKIALAIAAANMVLILLFPPFDQYSIAASRAPEFAGLNFYFNKPQYGVVNSGMLQLEVFVVLINAAIGWLVLQDKPASMSRRRLGYQNATLIAVGVNLVVVLLFPPLESVFSLTNAALPSFEGFYFIFSRPPKHTIVTTLLYLEVAFILVNGALLWLIFRDKAPELTPEEAYALATKLHEHGDK
jgi:hypothetical protein